MIDISPGMIAKAKEVGKYHGVHLEGYAAAGERLPVGDGEFDIVYLANVIHHVTNRPVLMEEIRRALKPGGRFFSFDPVAYNPVINVYRRMAMEVRTEDEPAQARRSRADEEIFCRSGIPHVLGRRLGAVSEILSSGPGQPEFRSLLETNSEGERFFFALVEAPGCDRFDSHAIAPGTLDGLEHCGQRAKA